MRRRALLASLAVGVAGIAGCNGNSSGSTARTPAGSPTTAASPAARTPTQSRTSTQTVTSTETPTPTETPPPTETPTDEEYVEFTGERTDYIVDVPTDPRATQFVDLETIDRRYVLPETEVEWATGTFRRQFRTTATQDHPVLVEGVFENTSEYTEEIGPYWPILPFVVPVSDRPRPWLDPCGDPYRPLGSELVAAPTANHDLVDDPPTIYRPESGLWRTNVATIPSMPDRVEVEPRERLYAEAAIVGRAGGVENVRPQGWYHFGESKVGVFEPDSPGRTLGSRFEGRSVPPIDGETPTTWFHETDRGSRLFFAPSTERVRPPATVRGSLLNLSLNEVAIPTTHPSPLHKLSQGEWFAILPEDDVRSGWPDDLDPGGSYCWEFHLHHETYSGSDRPEATTTSYVAENLGGGTYAIVGHYHDGPESPYDHLAAALITVNKPRASLRPDPTVSHARDGETVRVTDPAGDGGTETITVRRIDADPDLELIPEQASNVASPLKNVLPFFEAEGVDRVVYRTRSRRAHTMSNFLRRRSPGPEPPQFAFDGDAFEVTVTDQQ